MSLITVPVDFILAEVSNSIGNAISFGARKVGFDTGFPPRWLLTTVPPDGEFGVNRSRRLLCAFTYQLSDKFECRR